MPPRVRPFRPKLPRPKKLPLRRIPFRIPVLYRFPFGPLITVEGASLPEQIVATWLDCNSAKLGFTWRTQVPELGFEQRLPGGAKVDFEITYGAVRYYVRVQGNYWHLQSIGTIAKDRLQKLSLMAYGTVIDVWEDAIY